MRWHSSELGEYVLCHTISADDRLKCLQGFYLSLSVFKNLLASAPYQEVLLTTTGHDFFRIERHEDGRLEMGQLPMGAL